VNPDVLQCRADGSVDLLTSWRARDPAAIGEIYRRYAACVREVVGLRMGRGLRVAADSGDLVQELFVALLGTPPPLEITNESELVRYLTTGVINQLRDLHRAQNAEKRDRKREVALDGVLAQQSGLPAPDPSPSQVSMSREEYRQYLEAVQELPEREREAVILYRHEGVSSSEGARLLGMNSPAAFRTVVARALAKVTIRMNGP